MDQQQEIELQDAIQVYKNLKDQIELLEATQKGIKDRIIALMTLQGLTTVKTPVGSVTQTSDGVTVSYDAKAIDTLCGGMPELKALLGIYRKETQRAGS